MSKKIVIAIFAIVPSSLVTGAGSFEDSDLNEDGYINAEEAAATAKGLAAQLKTLDSDNNGKLDRAEFSKLDITVPEAASELPK